MDEGGKNPRLLDKPTGVARSSEAGSQTSSIQDVKDLIQCVFNAAACMCPVSCVCFVCMCVCFGVCVCVSDFAAVLRGYWYSL